MSPAASTIASTGRITPCGLPLRLSNDCGVTGRQPLCKRNLPQNWHSSPGVPMLSRSVSRVARRLAGTRGMSGAAAGAASVEITDGGSNLKVMLPGLERPFHVPADYIRDNDMTTVSRSTTSGQKLHDILSLGLYANEFVVDSAEVVDAADLDDSLKPGPFALSTVREATLRGESDAGLCLVAHLSARSKGATGLGAETSAQSEVVGTAPSDSWFPAPMTLASRPVPAAHTAVIPLPWIRRWAREIDDAASSSAVKAAFSPRESVPAPPEWPLMSDGAAPSVIDARVQPRLWLPEELDQPGAAPDSACAFHDWAEVTSSVEAHARWLGSLRSLGFTVLRGAPVSPETVETTTALFGPVRETAEYGRVFDVRVEDKVWNFTFNSAGLDVHSDNPYREPSPTVQLLNCVIPSSGGGDTMLVDAWRAAQDLGRDRPDMLEALSALPVTFEFKVRGAERGRRAEQGAAAGSRGLRHGSVPLPRPTPPRRPIPTQQHIPRPRCALPVPPRCPSQQPPPSPPPSPPQTGVSLGEAADRELGPRPSASDALAGGAHLEASTSMVRRDGPHGRISSVTFNSRSLGQFGADGTPDGIRRYYEAYLELSRRLNDPARQLRYKLDEGEIAVVVNHRVLHGRTAFSIDVSDAAAAAERYGHLVEEGRAVPARWLTGAYADVDSLDSTHRTLCHQIAAQRA